MESLNQKIQTKTESLEELFETGKNPGLGIRKLHEQGITGTGVVVGIIDQRISPTHSEFKDNIISNREYYTPESADDTEISMHGPAVVSLLVGKECGVAPGAKVVYGNINATTDGFLGYSKCLKDIIEYNEKNEPKIKIVSVSKGYDQVPGVHEWLELKKEAQESGITIIDSDYFNEHSITGGGSKRNKEQFDDYELPLFYSDAKKNIPSLKEVEDMVSSSNEDSQKKFFDTFGSYQGYIDTTKDTIIVPCDYRTTASEHGTDEYRYDDEGGWSWAIPYFSGVFALALQVNPDLSNDEFLEIVKKTAGRNKEGIKVINPTGIVEEVEKRVSKA
jgi:subtilisin family serine protease